MDVVRLRRPDWLFVTQAGHPDQLPLASLNHINPGAAPGYVYLHCERYEDDDVNGVVLKIARDKVDAFRAALTSAVHMHDEHWSPNAAPEK